MKNAIIIAAIAALIIAAPAQAAMSPISLTLPPRQIELVGPHVRGKGMLVWAGEAQVPLPAVRVGVYYGDPATYPGNQVYLPKVGRGGWTAEVVHGLFLHEMGHVFDRHDMTPALRQRFLQLAGVPTTCDRWWHACKTARWVSGPNVYVTLPPGEMFAEEYAACGLGLTQRGYQDAGYNSYGWVPPPGTDESRMCSLIRQAGGK